MGAGVVVLMNVCETTEKRRSKTTERFVSKSAVTCEHSGNVGRQGEVE